MTGWRVIVRASIVAVAWTGAVRAHDALVQYVGRSVCLECHESDGNVCVLEPIPDHLRSFEALFSPEAPHIATLCGVAEPPEQSMICLGCHATGAEDGPRWAGEQFRIEQGVQCEACHGPGGAHVTAATAGGAESIRRAPRYGLASRDDCQTCHVERLSHKEVLEKGFRIPEVDRMYKTPVNLVVAPSGNRLYVVCERSNSIAVVDTRERAVIDEIAVGLRPHDAAVSPDGKRLFVSNRFDASVSVVDLASRQAVAQVRVGGQPHGVALDASGEFLAVLCAGNDQVSMIDTRSLQVSRRLAAGDAPWSAALGSDGRTLYTTNAEPRASKFRCPPRSELTVIDVPGGRVVSRPVVEEANMLHGVAYVPEHDVVLFTMMRTKNLVPLTRLAQGWAVTNGLGVLWPEGRVDQVLLDQPNEFFADPMDVAVTPDGRLAFVASGGTDSVAVIDVASLSATITAANDEDRNSTLPNHLGMSARFVTKRLAVGSNPRALAVSQDGKEVFVANALEDALSIIDVGSLTVVGHVPLGGPDTITEIRAGERLFHSAKYTWGRQFSCRTCHPEGHLNGLTFDIEADGIGMHPVDNRSLHGILDTGPFKWEGTNPSLQRQCGARLAVFFTRLAPLGLDELKSLTRYLATIERPPNHHRSPEGLTRAQRRGKAIFDRTVNNRGVKLDPLQRCAHCHSGVYKSNGAKSAVGTTLWFDAPMDVEVNDLFDSSEFGELGIFYFTDVGVEQKILDVPHLNNIVYSAPYLHNGAAATLEEIWTRFNMVNRHGRTDDLTRQQLNDLIEYLKAL